MGFDTPSSLRRFMTEQDIYGDDDAMLRFHTKNNPSSVFREFQIYDYLCAIAEKLFGAGNCAEDRVLKRQYVQYEWIRLTMEQYRREKWFSSGLIYWMLNDCWPANGWAIIDYYARPKAAWYAMRRSCQDCVCQVLQKHFSWHRLNLTDGNGFSFRRKEKRFRRNRRRRKIMRLSWKTTPIPSGAAASGAPSARPCQDT